MSSRAGVPEETIPSGDETIFPTARRTAETNAHYSRLGHSRSLLMWTLINSFYRAYCRARLSEMRKFGLAN